MTGSQQRSGGEGRNSRATGATCGQGEGELEPATGREYPERKNQSWREGGAETGPRPNGCASSRGQRDRGGEEKPGGTTVEAYGKNVNVNRLFSSRRGGKRKGVGWK